MIDMNWREFVELLGADNAERIKTAITDEIISNLTEAIQQEWILMPSSVQVAVDSIADDVIEEIEAEYKEKLKRIMRADLIRMEERNIERARSDE